MDRQAHAIAVLTEAGHGSVIDDARKAGFSPAAILALLIKYGPLAMTILKEILDALKTPVPVQS